MCSLTRLSQLGCVHCDVQAHWLAVALGYAEREDLPKSFRAQTRAVWETASVHHMPPDDFLADVRKAFARLGQGLDWEVPTDDDLFVIDVVVDRERKVRDSSLGFRV